MRDDHDGFAPPSLPRRDEIDAPQRAVELRPAWARVVGDPEDIVELERPALDRPAERLELRRDERLGRFEARRVAQARAWRRKVGDDAAEARDVDGATNLAAAGGQARRDRSRKRWPGPEESRPVGPSHRSIVARCAPTARRGPRKRTGAASLLPRPCTLEAPNRTLAHRRTCVPDVLRSPS
jgi:hypothetical protein